MITRRPSRRDVLRAVGVGAGLLPLLDHGARLAAIHVVAPRALALPWGVGGEALWGSADPGFPDPEEPAPDPWDGARLAWHFIP